MRVVGAVSPAKLALVAVSLILGIQRVREIVRRRNAPRRLRRASTSIRGSNNIDLVTTAEDVNWSGHCHPTGQPVPAPPAPLDFVVLKAAFRCDVAAVQKFLFHPDSPFLRQWSNNARLENVLPGSWTQRVSSGGQCTISRELYYEIPVKAALGPSHANVTETQTITLAPWGFSVQVVARNPNVPFGTKFHTRLQFVCWPAKGGLTCLAVTARIEFTGSTGMLRGIICKSTQSGTRENYALVLRIMSESLPAVPYPADAEASLQALVEALAAGDEAAAAVMLPAPAADRDGLPSVKEVEPEATVPLPPSTLTSPRTTILVMLCAALVAHVLFYGLLPPFLPDLQRIVEVFTERYLLASMPVPGIPRLMPARTQ